MKTKVMYPKLMLNTLKVMEGLTLIYTPLGTLFKEVSIEASMCATTKEFFWEGSWFIMNKKSTILYSIGDLAQGSFHRRFHVCTNQGGLLRRFLTNNELKFN